MPVIILVLSFFIWSFCFRGFLSGELALSSDAVSYYDHIKFFIESLSRGEFALWDPVWNSGVPNDFFLRRFCPYNPFYLVMIAFIKSGLPYKTAYLMFLAGYYWLGIVGFYLLARLIYRNPFFAVLATLLLLFSSLGTRLFDSFILLIFIPLVWFFYFLVRFFQKPDKGAMIGIVFATMILVTTYVPFYFITIVVSFLSCYGVLYYVDVKTRWISLRDFMSKYKFFMMFCTFAVLIAFIPGVTFFFQAGEGQLALPLRNYEADTANIISVNTDIITNWGIEEDLAYSYAFNDLRQFKFAVLYVPITAIILFFIGWIAPLTRRTTFLFTWVAVLFLVFCHYSPVYYILYKWIFYFKYFRNLHFYLWIVMLPVFVLLVCDQLQCLFAVKKAKVNIVLLTVIHVGVLIYLIQSHGLITSIAAVILTWGMIMMFFLKKERPLETFWMFGIMTLAVIIQPLEVYHYLQKNSALASGGHIYDEPYQDFRYENELITQRIHYGTKWYHYCLAYLDFDIFRNYLRNKFYVYDHAQWIQDENDHLSEIEKALKENINVAFISSHGINRSMDFPTASYQRYGAVVTSENQRLQVLEFKPNQIKIRTDFPTDKILVYNDSYHPKWQAYVNDEKVELMRANIAFKGFWLRAGKNTIALKYGSIWDYVLQYAILITFIICFALVLGLNRNSKKIC